MTHDEAHAGVEAWAGQMKDRLWLGQFRLNIHYEDSDEGLESGGRPAGRCMVNHDYGEVDIYLYHRNLDDQEELFHVLLHEVCHAVVFEFWHIEYGILPPLLERDSERVKQIVKRTFTYAHERFVQRIMSIILDQHPYPDAWAKPTS